MKLLVTGGAGFIGSHVVDALLQQGHSVSVLDNFHSGREANLSQARATAKSKGLEFHVLRGDISDPQVWQDMPAHDGIFHFAAQTSVTASVENPEYDFKCNVESAVHILKWIRAKRIKYFLYANTAGAMYGQASILPSPEETPLLPLAPYGATKAFTETYIHALCQSLKSSGVWSNDTNSDHYFSWASFRLANVYGPRQYPKGEAGVVPIFLEMIAEGKTPIIFGDGTKTRDYVNVRDVASAFMLGFEKMQKEAVDDAFNLAFGAQTTDQKIYDVTNAALKNLAQRKPNEKYARALTVGAAKYATIRPGEVLHSAPSPAKIGKKWGWKAQVTLEAGIVEVVERYWD